MNDEARLLLTIWEGIEDFISTGDRQEAAANIIRSLVELGNDIALLHDAEGEDVYLDRALDEVMAEAEEDAEPLDDIEEEGY